jgi:hypothetical protein
MPNIVVGNSIQSPSTPVSDQGYQYPYGVNLKPGSEIHNLILTKLIRMSDDSFSVMSQRHKTWNEIDKTLKVYIPADAAEAQTKAKDPRKPISIVVPYSYATLETMMAYFVTAFLGDEPFRFDGSAPKDTVPAKLLELVVNQQSRRFKSTLDMYASIRDSLSYGLGASTLNWKQVWGMKPTLQQVPNYSPTGIQLPSTQSKVNVKAMLFEGNEVINIDPYRLLPDPNTSIHNVQAMEFIGWIDFVSMNRLLAEDQTGSMFNVKYIPNLMSQARSSRYFVDPSRRILSREQRDTPNSTKYVTLVKMYCEIIPKDWKLPGTLEGNKSGEYPEKWLFVMANEQWIIKAQPLGLNHQMYPIATCAPDFDGYSITPLARMELIGGLQTALDWMFNSHVANVRKAINDMLIVDPSMINMEDLRNPEPGKLVRLRRSAWGRGVDNAVKQLAVTDITANNMKDAEQLMGMMSRCSAASDATQGIVRDTGERVSASEFNGTMKMAISRLARMSRMISVQYMQDLGMFHASHTQQLMSVDTFVKAVGDWPHELMSEFQNQGINYGDSKGVSPFDIIADYDVIFRDGTTSSATAEENDFWSRSFETMASQPTLAGSFDLVRVFTHMARINGAKNANDFIKRGGNVQPTIMDNQQVQQQAQAGNIVDLNQWAQTQGAR